MTARRRIYTIPIGDCSVAIESDDDGSFPQGDALRMEVSDRLMESLMGSDLVMEEDLLEFTEEAA